MALAPLPAQSATFTYWRIKENDFINFEWTRERIWQGLRTRADFDKAMDACRQGAYGEWGGHKKAKHFITTWALGQHLQQHEEGIEIAMCFDLQQAFYAFREYYTAWRERPLEWNDDSNAAACQFVGSKNVFTGRCDDAPDWRTDKQRAQDRHKMARLAHKKQQELEAVESLLEAIRNGS